MQLRLPLFAATLAANLAAQAPQWLVASPAPRARVFAAMANDPRSGEPLLFSGLGSTAFVGSQLASADLWQWTGSSWARRTAVGPPPRHGASMALDLVRGLVVLFGGTLPSGWSGSAAGTVLADTWEFDGSSWTQRRPAQWPPASRGNGMAYDPLRQRSVLFSSVSGTWEWDGNNWTQAQPVAAPPVRQGPGLAFDGSAGGILMYGGIQSPSGLLLDDTWLYNGLTWTRLAIGNPPARMEPAMAFDAARGRTVLFGGTTGQMVFTDTWEFGPNGWQQIAGTGPQLLAGATMTHDLAHGGELLHGTEVTAGGVLTAATWSWNGSSWSRPAVPATPPLRSFHGFVQDAQSQDLLLFGGISGDHRVLDDTWRLRGGRWQQLQPAASPPSRVWPQLACDRLRNRVVLFGGDTSTTALGDTWEWDGVNWTQRFPANSPPPRAHGTMAGDAARGNVLLFGGTDRFTYFGDTWTFDGNNWVLAASTGPNPRIDAASTWDGGNQRVLLFAGNSPSPSNLQDDLWSWNGSGWTLLQAATRPQPRSHHGMAFDPLRQVAVVFGGQVVAEHANTWEWNGAAWAQTWSAPTPEFLPIGGGTTAAMAFDEQQQCLVAYDGLDLWHYTRTPASSAVYGTGCGGSRGPLQLAAPDRPYLGHVAFPCELSAAPPGQPALLLIGLQAANVPLGGGCQLLLGAPQPWLFAGIPSSSDTALLSAPLPAAAALVGLQVRVQAGVLDGSAPLGFGLSNGLLLRLGH